MKDTCKQAIFRKDTKRAKRVEDLWTAGDQDKRELEFFDKPHEKLTKHPTPVPNGEKSAPSDTPTVYIKSNHDDGPTSSKRLPGFNPDDLVGRTFYYLLWTVGRD